MRRGKWTALPLYFDQSWWSSRSRLASYTGVPGTKYIHWIRVPWMWFWMTKSASWSPTPASWSSEPRMNSPRTLRPWARMLRMASMISCRVLFLW
ncbi:Uncharacterised protein [Flavonifractor plautii]|uniref:Uncharacterized protein n=1 Tax=Flavonifractor plautii TaxID=292800 RepID=A0A174MKE5_FLAPL|nr:Uncharacterised protein [Flavonifractor plautii]